jgi:transcriptional regulator with XRE-family HTH domain
MHESFPLADLLRRARRLADLSQRDLAARAGVSRSLVGRLEAGDVGRASILTLTRLLSAAGLRLAVVDGDGEVVTPMPSECMRDQAGRHFPAHLDVRRWRRHGHWWYDFYRTTILPGPTHTFDRNRRQRDGLRQSGRRSARDLDERHEICEPRPPDWRAADVSRRSPWRPARRSGWY